MFARTQTVRLPFGFKITEFENLLISGVRRRNIPVTGEESQRVNLHRFRDKTVNDWADRKSFSKVPGKYDLLEMDYGSDKNGKSVGDDEAGPSTPDNVDGDLKVPESVLDTRLQVRAREKHGITASLEFTHFLLL